MYIHIDIKREREREITDAATPASPASLRRYSGRSCVTASLRRYPGVVT